MPQKADGEIWVKVELDSSPAQKELNKLQKSIEKQVKIVEELREKAEDSQQKSVFSAAALDAEKAKLYEMRKELESLREIAKNTDLDKDTRAGARAQIPALNVDVREQAERVRAMQSEYNKLANQAERYAEHLKNAEKKLDEQTVRAGELVQELAAARRSASGMSPALEQANERMEKLNKRIKEVVKSAFLFSVITKGLTELKEWAANVVKANDEARKSIAQLKGALLTLVQPLVDVLIPAFIYLVDILTRLANTAGQITSMLFGKTIEQSSEAAKALNEETKALENVGNASEEASKSMASFDEINQLSTNEKKNRDNASSKIEPEFAPGEQLTEEKLKNILATVSMIGAAIAAWKLSDGFSDGLKKFVGLLAAIAGGIMFAEALWEAWTEGVTWDNFSQTLLGLTLLALGLGLAFGKVGAGIGLILGGLAMLVTGFKDAETNGFNFQNTLLSIAGIIATGLGISLLTGSFIPLLIAAIASVILAIVVAAGKGEELIDGLKTVFGGLVDFVKGVFTGDLELAMSGVERIFAGLGSVVSTIIESIKILFFSFLEWLDEKTGGKLFGIIEFTKGLFDGVFTFIDEIVSGTLDGIMQSLNGLLLFISGVFTQDWDAAWRGVLEILFGICNGVVSAIEGAINLVIKGLNWIIEKTDGLFGFGVDTIGEVSLKKLSLDNIPALAQGAVIPPNRRFLAVLGDQTSGTNVEAPLSTIEQAVENVLARSGGIGGGELRLKVTAAPGFTRYLKFELDAENTRQGGKLVQNERLYT